MHIKPAIVTTKYEITIPEVRVSLDLKVALLEDLHILVTLTNYHRLRQSYVQYLLMVVRFLQVYILLLMVVEMTIMVHSICYSQA